MACCTILSFFSSFFLRKLLFCIFIALFIRNEDILFGLNEVWKKRKKLVMRSGFVQCGSSQFHTVRLIFSPYLSETKTKKIFISEVYYMLNPSSIYSHFNTLKKKILGKHCGKRWNCSKWFLCNLYLLSPLIATFQLSSTASLNLGRFQNVALGMGWLDKSMFANDSIKG